MSRDMVEALQAIDEIGEQLEELEREGKAFVKPGVPTVADVRRALATLRKMVLDPDQHHLLPIFEPTEQA